MTSATEAIEAALDVVIEEAEPVSGGDNARGYRLRLDDGRKLFCKTMAKAPPFMMTTEAASLRWLRAADAVRIPEVVAVSDGDEEAGEPNFLVLEWMDPGRIVARTDPELGRALATLHQAGAPSFGRADRRTTGSRGLPNEPCDTWAEFYATQRLLPLARLAQDTSSLGDRAIVELERLAGRLDVVGGPPEPPARLHGDLWAGNRLVDHEGRSWLIDPAAHGGHREFDLAMMRLFGGFGPDCFAAYAEATPLAPGAADRVALHQIAPLVVHAIKFGGSYVSSATQAIATYA